MIHFIRPWWFLALIPVIVLVIRLYKRSKGGGAWQKVCDPHLLSHILHPGEGASTGGVFLLAAIWVFMVIGLAGPSLEEEEQTVYQSLQSRVIVLDLSESMDAEDVKPSRLARAKFKVIDLLDQERSGRTAFIVFAGEPYVVSPLTQDTKTLADMVPVLETELMPAKGHDIGAALEKARALLIRAGVTSGDVILITDSVPDAGARKSAAALRSSGYRLDVLAIGTQKGAPIPSESGFVSDKYGSVVMTKLPMRALETLAATGGGKAIHFTFDDSDVQQLLTWLDVQGPAESVADTIRQWVDEGYWFALLAALFMLPLCRRTHEGGLG